jgi:enoyl-CoA hydratase
MIDLDFRDGVAVVTLNDPARRNALDAQASTELVEACEAIDGNADVGAAVLRGAGGYFCSGGDRDELASASADPLSDAGYAALSGIYEAFLRVGRLQVPVVAAVRGGAVGAGLNLVLACDVRIMADDAVLAAGFDRLGVHPGGGHFALLTRAGGLQTAVAVGVLGHALTGVQAVEHGLALACPPDSEVEEFALRLASRAGADPALSRAAIRSARLVGGPPALPWAAAVEVERAAQLRTLARKGREGWGHRARAVD